jgi:peptidoglycan hydrolase-like protein with peptidoglycan-binding domain
MMKETIVACQAAALQYKVPLATVLAVVEQESAGVVYAPVDGKNMPIVRHEGHYLYARLKGAQRELAVKKGLASPKVGGIANYASQQMRWDKLLKPAMAINKDAEIESVSWGVGQVMGANWSKLGYASATDFFDQVCSGVTMQVDVMMRYCKAFNLIDELQRGNYVGFARGYNGSGAVGSYSSAIAAKAKEWAKSYPPGTIVTSLHGAGRVDEIPVANVKTATNAQTMLRLGTSGAAVRSMQELLHRAGYAVEVDGDFGPSTKEAVMQFQKINGLEIDGVAGPSTLAKLDAFKVDPSEQPGVPGPAEAIVKTPEGRQGAATAGIGTIVTGAIEPAKAALAPLVGHSLFIDHIYATLTVAGVVVILGGLVWTGVGWYRANTTRGVKGA